MNETLTNLIDTAIKIKENFSNEEIRLEITEDFVKATVTTNAVNDLSKLFQMTKGYDTRLVPVDNKLEIRLYLD